jgi:hypothetical protein
MLLVRWVGARMPTRFAHCWNCYANIALDDLGEIRREQPTTAQQPR